MAFYVNKLLCTHFALPFGLSTVNYLSSGNSPLSAGGATAAVVTCRNGSVVDARVSGAGIVLQSEGYSSGLPYPNNYVCNVTLFSSSRMEKIRLDFEDFDVEVSAHCRADKLVVSDVFHGVADPIGSYCASERPKPILSTSHVVRVSFVSNALRSGGGFRIRVTPTTAWTVCTANEYQCMDRTCIPYSKRCDGVFDCEDASDEECAFAKPSLSRAECGKPVIPPTGSRSDRVVGGEEAVPHSWPWQVSIQRKGSEPVGHFCGGTLVARQWVIGAAHCFAEGISRANQVVVKAGLHDMLNPSQGQQTRPASLITWHPRFDGGKNMNYDIALIKVSLPFNYTDTVRPACVPVQGEGVAPGTTCYSTGWGHTRGSGHAFRLKQMKMRVEEFEKCENTLMRIAGIRGSNTICASSTGDVSGPCHGDSGGPLICKDKDGAWVVYGATSMGIEGAITNSICGMGMPSLWSSVASHGNWIRYQVSRN